MNFTENWENIIKLCLCLLLQLNLALSDQTNSVYLALTLPRVHDLTLVPYLDTFKNKLLDNFQLMSQNLAKMFSGPQKFSCAKTREE